MKQGKTKKRDLVDLKALTNEIISRTMQIDYWKKDNNDCLPALKGTHQIARPAKSSHAPSVKEKHYRRAAEHVCNQLFNSKSKKKESKLELTTYHRYLTRIKNTVRAGIGRHNPDLPSVMADLQAKYPQYTGILCRMVGDDQKRVGKVKAGILKELSDLNKVDADELHAEISALSKSGKIEHPIIKYLALTEAQQQRRKTEIGRRLKERKTNKQSYTLGFIRRVTDECLHSNNFNELAIGIALATGRRAIEVVYRGGFKAAGKHSIEFSGQAKKGKGVVADAYIIPTLADAELITDAVERLRRTDKCKAIFEDISTMSDELRNEKVNTSSARMLNYTVKKVLTPDDTQKESPAKFKDCRMIALQAAILKIMPNKEYNHLDVNEFVLRYQGHDRYEEFANYQDIAVTDEDEPEQPEQEEAAPKKPENVSAATLEGADLVINDMGKKTLYKLHGRVKEWAVRTGAAITKANLYKGVDTPTGVDKAGGSYKLINDYLNITAIAEAVSQHNEDLQA